MTQDNAKILKLSSGEEIICNVSEGSNNGFVSVTSPMKIQSYPRATREGLAESLSLQRWIHFAETNTYNVPESQIIVMTEASYGLSKFYEYCVKKMDIEEENILSPTREELQEIEYEEEWDDEYGEPLSKVYH